jgi:hypothetical protein
MLIKHRPSHLTQGPVFPFHNTILGRRIRTQKLMFKTDKNQLETPDPRERPYRQGPLESPKSENHQAETTPQNPHPTAGTQKANYIQAIEQEQYA